MIWGFAKCDYSFYEERDKKLELLDKNSEQYEVLDNLDVDTIKDSIQYEDGICWSESFCGYSEEEMKVYIEYLKESFEKLVGIIGYIDGFPEE